MMQNHFQPNANILFDGIVTPNPNDGLFTYRANNFSHENITTVEIINSIGLKLISKEIVSENTFFDLSKYGKGVYFLKVMNGTKIKIEKVVVH
nr:T9SS type A sorting domain-containing protein [Bacteroidota bacterium]